MDRPQYFPAGSAAAGWQRLVERPVALLTEFCSDCRRVGQWSGCDVEIDRADLVLHLRYGVSECTAEFLGRVVPVVDAASSCPLDLERNNRWDRRACVACYRILEVPVVLYVKIVRFEGCGARVQVNLHIACGEDNGPEEAILRDSRVEIVDLRVPQLGVVEVNSDKREGAVPHVAVSSPVNALQEGHVIHVRVQIVLYEARPPVCLRRRRVNKGDAGSALEVPHGGRVGVGPRERRFLHVNVYAEDCQRVGDGQHVTDAWSGRGGHGPQEPRAERPADHRCANRGLEELPSRKRCVPREMARDQRVPRLNAIRCQGIESHAASVRGFFAQPP